MGLQYHRNTATQALPDILKDLLEFGEEVGSRNGRVMELLNTQVTIDQPYRREILNPNRKANIFAQIAETMWVLSGKDNAEWLSAYLPRALDYSDDGSTWRAGYGPRLRNFKGVDQLARVVKLLKKDPLTRQAVIQIWDISDGDLTPLKDRACNTQLQFQSRLGKLHLTVTVRSNDMMWGWSGINAFEWSTLQEIVASLVGIQMGSLVFNIGNMHLYEEHWARARSICTGEETSDLAPSVTRFDTTGDILSVKELDYYLAEWFDWEALCRNGKATLKDLEVLDEPLFRTWAIAIAYYWQRDEHWLALLDPRSALVRAMAQVPTSVLPEPTVAPSEASSAAATGGTRQPHEAFYKYVADLHAVKHESYGDSWRKRGEMLSILPNIARKVDRLGTADKFDSSADTLVDLWVYMAKYLCWLGDNEDCPENVNYRLKMSLKDAVKVSTNITVSDLKKDMDTFLDHVESHPVEYKFRYIQSMLPIAGAFALDQWYVENEYRGADAD